MHSVRTLLASIVDYAGLFPPAALDMATAVRNYCLYHEGDYKWMLGAFVVPASRLGELVEASRLVQAEDATASWPLSVLVGSDVTSDVECANALTQRPSGEPAGDHALAGTLEALELRADSPATISEMHAELPGDVAVYWEVPTGTDPAPYLKNIARVGHRAKIRTGGIRETAFPSADAVVRFIAACHRTGVIFKATAGLHHPLSGLYPLTYEPGSPSASMYGYLNVFLAAAAIAAGFGEEAAQRVLTETESSVFMFEPQAVVWRGLRFELGHLSGLRKSLAASFGSCSFEEPVDELKGIVFP